jgi:hypothetical protein
MAETKMRTCYVISPIGEKGSSTRRRSDQVMKHLVAPAVAPFGYEVRRSDSDAEPGEIPAQIIRQMATAELVIADLSDFNPNVFYELAIRHVAAKPLVQMIAAGQTVPFDVGHLRTVYFNLTDPDDLEEAREELAKHVKALQDVDQIETPIKASLGLQQALESTDPATAGNAEILAELQTVRADLERLRAAQSPYLVEWKGKLDPEPVSTRVVVHGTADKPPSAETRLEAWRSHETTEMPAVDLTKPAKGSRARQSKGSRKAKSP